MIESQLSRAEHLLTSIEATLGQVSESQSLIGSNRNVTNTFNDLKGLLSAIQAMLDAETNYERKMAFRSRLRSLHSRCDTLSRMMPKAAPSTAISLNSNSTHSAYSLPAYPIQQTTTYREPLYPQNAGSASLQDEVDPINEINSQLDTYIDLTRSTNMSLLEQRRKLARAYDKMNAGEKALHSAGVVMKVIIRRALEDKAVLFIGIISLLILSYLCWRILGYKKAKRAAQLLATEAAAVAEEIE